MTSVTYGTGTFVGRVMPSFTLQGAAEAYMGGFFHDVNLCALHRKVKTINHKDVTLTIEICGREHVGGKPQMSDVGVCQHIEIPNS